MGVKFEALKILFDMQKHWTSIHKS
jgi:hypothetical protein